MNVQAGQSRGREVIVIDDDDESSNDFGFDSDYNEDDWEDANMDALQDIVFNNHAAQQNKNPRLGQDAMPGPYAQQRAQNVDEAREEQHQPTPDECMAQVFAVFPDICPNYLANLYNEIGHGGEANMIVAAICENMEQGKPYPKGENERKGLKRKRELTAAEEAQKIYGAPDRNDDANALYKGYVRHVLSLEFKNTPVNFIDGVLRVRKHLFQAYQVLEEAERTLLTSNPRPYKPIKNARAMDRRWTAQRLEGTIAAMIEAPHNQDEVRALQELSAARKVREEADEKRAATKRAEEAELLNIQIAEREGTMKECGCCYCDYPLNRMVHCNSEGDLHWFCRDCSRKAVEHVIGNSRYEVTCMSMDGCNAGFSRDQMLEFLDEKSFIALDRNEQEAVLRMAGIENLESCPFCPYAAEYPPVEEDKEFRCQRPECEKVSCRLCKLETHIPKTCEEFARENGLSIRRQIEEAMTAAMVRTCNKCGTPFVKEAGCNKMTCMRGGCHNVQCYVCSKSCSYDHFNDTSRGGKKGNCPLFESAEERHEEEVNRAEAEAIRKVRQEHPEYTEDDLRVKVSENVKKDDERRKAMNPGPMPRPPPIDHMRGPGHVLGHNPPPDPGLGAHEYVFGGELPDFMLDARRAAQDRALEARQRGYAARMEQVRQRIQPGFGAPQAQPVLPQHPGPHVLNFAEAMQLNNIEQLNNLGQLNNIENILGAPRPNIPPAQAQGFANALQAPRFAQPADHLQQVPQFGAPNMGVDFPGRRHMARDMNVQQQGQNGARHFFHRLGAGQQRDQPAHQQSIVPQMAPVHRAPQMPLPEQRGGIFDRLGPLGRRAVHAFASVDENAPPLGSPGNANREVAPNSRPRRRQGSFH